jgi:hypothetical protein
VGDPLRIWREVTRAHQVALFMHYSGVWDMHAVRQHPDWAAVDATGKPSAQATSVLGPYVDQLMIPQLRELAGDYGVDGVWVDGDCWGVMLDYGAPVVRAFCQQTGALAAPRKAGEPFWQEWKEFNRAGFRHYLRRYVDALKNSHPQLEVISNWAFSDHMPEPVTAQVAALSGDFSPSDSVNSARFSGRCLENQGQPWDLMSWSFTGKPRRQKSAVQLQQEAAEILALGGGYQAYFTAERQPFRLLVSLTSADPEVRRTLMPIEQTYPTPALLDALRAYHAATGARVTLAWPLLGGINTRAADAQRLAQLTRGLPIKLDLIDVNDPSGRFHPPSTEERHAFRDALRQYLAAPVARRYSGGQDIHAACGMLAGARAGEELATEDAAVTEKKPRTKLHRRISNKEGRSTAAADREPPPQAENRPPA